MISKYFKQAFLILIALFLIMLPMACEKDGLYKNPTTISFSINMDTTGIGPSDDLLLSNGRLILSEVSISGQRPMAENFEFIRSFDTGISINLDSNNYVSELEFDLPQGEYSAINLSFKSFVDTNSISILGNYSYSNPSKPSSIVQFEHRDLREFNLNLIDSNNTELMLLNEGDAQKIQISLDPKFWFKEVPVPLLNNANFDLIDGNQVIRINESSNLEIYNIVNAAIGGNLSFQIE